MSYTKYPYSKLIDLIPIGNLVQDMESLMDKSFEKAVNKMNNCLVDIYVAEDEYIIVAECAGYKDSQLNVQIVEGCLEISGDRSDSEYSGLNSLLKERVVTKFTRHIDIPRDVDTDSIDANLDNGLLVIKLKKKDQVVRGKKVSINKSM